MPCLATLCIQVASSKAPVGDLMHVSADVLEGMLVVCGKSATAVRAAQAHVVAVDPPSQGVPLHQLRKLHADVAASRVAVYFSTASKVCKSKAS